MKRFFQKIYEMLFDIKVTPLQWLAVFAGVVAIRVFIEKFSQGFPNETLNYIATFYIQNLFFFLLTFLLIWLWLSFILKTNPSSLANILLWSSWLIVFPPIIDIIWTGGDVYWSFYLLNDIPGLWLQFYTIFGNLPSAIVYFGTKITIILAISLLSLYVLWKTRNPFKFAANILVTYTIFFFMASFPSWFSFMYYSIAKGKNIMAAGSLDIVAFLATPATIFSIKTTSIINALSYKLDLIYFIIIIFLLGILFYLSSKQQFRSFFEKLKTKNIILVSLMFLVGFVLGSLNFPDNYNLNIFSVFAVLALLTSLFLSTTVKEYLVRKETISEEINHKEIAIVVLIIALAGGFIVNFKFFIIIFLINLLSILYATNKSLTVNLLTIIGTAVLSVTIGYILLSDSQNMQDFPWITILLIIIGYITIEYFLTSKIIKGKQVVDAE